MTKTTRPFPGSTLVRSFSVAAALASIAPAHAQSPGETNPTCIGGLPTPTQIRMSVGKSTLVNMQEPIVRRTLGDPEVVDAKMVSPEVMYLVSGRIGATNAIVQGRSGRCTVLDIVVTIDTEVVQAKLAELLPHEKGIRVSSASDSLVLAGTVLDAVSAERAVAIANAFVRSYYQQGFSRAGGTALMAGTAPGQTTVAGATPLLTRVVNLLSVAAPQQVMVEVKVAEVSKKLLDQLGASYNATRTTGNFTYQILGNFLSGTLGTTFGITKNALNNMSFEAQTSNGLVRILAEPSVMAISGQEGSFLAGGKILIPVASTNTTGYPVLTLDEKEFGVGLKFTPTVLGDGKINLRVAPEVSELSPQGVNVSSTGSTTSSVLPLIVTRRASTTVQLYDGQSFVIGGLIKSSSAGTLKGLPVLGELPIIGPLFRSTDFLNDQSEVVFVVTPRLVKPLPPDFELPTDKVGLPSRADVLLRGRLDTEARVAPATASSAPAAAASKGGMELK